MDSEIDVLVFIRWKAFVNFRIDIPVIRLEEFSAIILISKSRFEYIKECILNETGFSFTEIQLIKPKYAPTC